MVKRCSWVDEKSEIYKNYHDHEWGVPVYDDEKLYEMFLLETFQAGLSWITILKKREAFRVAFDFSDYLWGFSNHQIIKNKDNNFKTTTKLSDDISIDLKKRGMSFVGSITIYSYLQAIGIVDDHELECFCYKH